MEEFLLKGLSFMQKNVLHFPASGKTSTFAHWWMELFTECSKKNKLAQTDCRACNTRQLHNGCICHRWICNSYHWNPYFNWTVIFCNCIRKLDHTNTKLHVEWLHVDFHAVCRKDFFLFVLLSACDSRWVLVYLSLSLSGFHQNCSPSACTGLISRRISCVHTSHISGKNDHWY